MPTAWPRCCRLARLRVKGFKSLRDLTLELMPVTILVRPNGSGKTAVIEALLLLRDILGYLEGRVANPFLRWWGYRNIAWKHREDQPIELRVVIDCSRCSLEQLKEYTQSLRVHINEESLEHLKRGVDYSIVIGGAGAPPRY